MSVEYKGKAEITIQISHTGNIQVDVKGALSRNDMLMALIGLSRALERGLVVSGKIKAVEEKGGLKKP